MAAEQWPALPYDEWAPTKKTLQMCAQMLGKVRLALAPPQPEWLHACLYLDPHGFTTGTMPYGDLVVSLGIDIFASEIRIRLSDGRYASVSIGPDRCVADIWAGLVAELDILGITVDVWEKPQEILDVTPFSENRHDCTMVPEHAQRYHRILSSLDGVYEEFRSQFFGRTGVQFWWGAFDFAVLLFNGKHLDAPDDKGYIMRYDLDAEHFNAGFWAGDDSSPTPGFFAYIVPPPDGCETARIDPEHAGWVEAMGEWLLPYDAVASCDDPRQAVMDFLSSTYSVALTHGGWNAEELTYRKPAPAPRG